MSGRKDENVGSASSAGSKLSEAEKALRPIKKRLIIYSSLAAVCVMLLIADTLAICLNAELSDDFKVYIFLAGFLGFVIFAVQMIRQARDLVRTRKQAKKTVAPAFEEADSADDVIRKPVDFDDEAGKSELEAYTANFLKNVVYPDGFEEFLKDGETTVFIHYYKDGYDVDYFEMDGKYDADEIKSINLDFIVYADDYHTQFRNVLFFADDLSGHCHFLLDYGDGGEPKVKYLDDEYDEVTLLADSFKEFLEDTVTPKKAKELLGKQYYGCYEEED